MNHKGLLEVSAFVLDSYDKDTQSVEEHVNRCLKEYGIYDEDEQTFIVEVFSGCVRYAEVLDVVMRGFFAKDGKTVLRSEQNLYAVLVYLALFRLDELGMANYRQFVKSQDINRMYKFLRFFFNEKSLTGWMKDAWQKYYEHVFVQTKLVSPLRRWLPELVEMVGQMKEKIDNITKPQRKALTSTEIKPFNITQPRPKSVPVPEPIPKLQKHKPPPDTLYKLPTELSKIERIRQENRRKAEERLMEASRRQFACANPEKSQKTKEKIQNILSEEDAKLDFDKPKTNKAPSFLMTPHSSRSASSRRYNQDVPVKMTAAAILREGAFVAELQLSKAKELAKIEEQQRAIHNLKTNLIDDLNSRGVLSDPETQAVIKRHQEEQEQLNARLDSQRQQQEKMLKQKLQLRLEQREKSMIQQQDEELKNLVAPNKTAAKIKKMLLIHKHMVAMEKMKNQLEREVSQTLEQVRYEYEVCKRKAIQNQEMDFIAGLVRVGTIPKDELESVVRMLYPGKSEEEFKEIFDKIFDPRTQPTQGPQMSKEEVSLRRSSKKKKDSFQTPQEQQQYYDADHFEDHSRFRPSSRQFEDTSRFQHPGRQTLDETQQFRPSSRQSFEDTPHPLEQGYSLQGSLRQNDQVYANPIMEEEDDVVKAQYMSDDRGFGQPLPAQLPPITATHRKKKKKKFLKKMANSPRTEEDYAQ